MVTLFEPSRIRSLVMKNRTVRSATHEGLADAEGRVTPELIGVLTALAEGEVGLIISGHAAVSPVGRASPRQLMVHDDGAIEGLTAMASAVHKAGGVIALQIAHAGIFARPPEAWQIPYGPSAADFPEAPHCRALERDEMEKVAAQFAAAALRGKNAGFDAVQIHAAHTYMLSQFLSPFFNKRTDEYGGSLQNRARLLLQVVAAVREAVGFDYPVLVKINSEDYLENGFSEDDSLSLSSLLEQAGVDAIELSGGSFLPFAAHSPSRKGRVKTAEDELYYRAQAAKIKQRVGIPLMLVGGLHSLETAQKALSEEIADYLALCRPLICEPDLVRKWRLGLSVKSECISDNLCFTPLAKQEGVCCVTFARKRGAGAVSR